MIKGMHGLFYSTDAEAARAFFRDKLGFAHVDAGDGWLIFGIGGAEFGVHPGDGPKHDISFLTDDIEATVKELEGKGVAFTTPITDHGWGLGTSFEIPGGGAVMLYQPRHPQP